MPHAEVAIVGAGPAGMSAAVCLARHGVRVTVFEALDDLSKNSRASTFHPPTLELLDTVGVYPAMAGLGLRVDTFQYRSRHHGLLAELDLSVLSDDTDFPFRLQLEQNRVTHLLRDQLEATGGSQILYGHRLDSLQENDDVVHLRFAGVEHGYTADWVLGADGASSVVRDALGVAFDGTTYEDRFLTVTTPFPLQTVIDDIAPVNYVSDADDWIVLLQVPDAWRLLFPVSENADPDDLQARQMIASRLAGVHPDLATAEITEWTLYRVHQRVAERMHQGRVALIGDAGHVNSPIGGMGMNSGIHDAFAVATALARILDGSADEALLAERAEHRRRVALDFVQVVTDRNTRNLVLDDPNAEQRRREELSALASDKAAMRNHLLRASMLDVTRDLVATVRDHRPTSTRESS